MTFPTLRRRLAAVAALTFVAATAGSVLAPAAQAAPAAPAASSTPAAPKPPLSGTGNPANFDWTNATIDVPWTSVRLADGTRCAGGRTTFRALAPGESDYGVARKGRVTLLVRKVDTADVDRDGKPDQVVHFVCQKTNTDVGYEYYYVYSFKKVHAYRGHYRYQPFVRDYVTSSDFAANALWLVQKIDARYGAVDVRQWVRAKRSVTVNRTFRWTNHRGLVANRPLPIHPEADRAPR